MAKSVVGLDEVGRGALAGPIIVGAVVLRCCEAPPEGLNDSKLLSPARARVARRTVGEMGGGLVARLGERRSRSTRGDFDSPSPSPRRAPLTDSSSRRRTPSIDGPFNLLARRRLDVALGACAAAAAALPVSTRHDDHQGRRRCATIAAASVLAKVHRDALMVGLRAEYDDYGWASNKGYGVPGHLEAIRRRAVTSTTADSWRLPERGLVRA